ncbi:MAG: hypothetical protein AAGF01_22715 [Cyanobacteria bacterium P01_G01_bin.38]
MSFNFGSFRKLGSLLAGMTVVLWASTAQATSQNGATAQAAPQAAPPTQDIALSFEFEASGATDKATSPAPSVELSFTPPAPSNLPESKPPDPNSPEPGSQSVPTHSLTELFAAGSDSLVAIAVGNAEGTRTPTGGYTSAYYGHVDPGNSVWNLGSFSYQHGAASPQAADVKQLRRLKAQAAELRRQARGRHLKMSVEAEINGIDLANQAPLAALDRGYIDWLYQAQQLPLDEAEQIIWARTRAFIDPDTGQWNAPGLGNTFESIKQDQTRRYQAITRVLGP